MRSLSGFCHVSCSTQRPAAPRRAWAMAVQLQPSQPKSTTPLEAPLSSRALATRAGSGYLSPHTSPSTVAAPAAANSPATSFCAKSKPMPSKRPSTKK